mgnify:CR=1 FL=1
MPSMNMKLFGFVRHVASSKVASRQRRRSNMTHNNTASTANRSESDRREVERTKNQRSATFDELLSYRLIVTDSVARVRQHATRLHAQSTQVEESHNSSCKKKSSALRAVTHKDFVATDNVVSLSICQYTKVFIHNQNGQLEMLQNGGTLSTL